jgi:hypothetical protein
MMADLAALTPPLVVCAGFIVGLVLLLRHQLAPKRNPDANRSADEDAKPGNFPDRT